MVAGNFSIDETISPDGAMSTAPGGDALYSALGAAIWRCPVGILSRIGRDYPAQLWDQLRSWGWTSPAPCTPRCPQSRSYVNKPTSSLPGFPAQPLRFRLLSRRAGP